MSSTTYVWEKLCVAIDCMCGDGDFTSRLKDATISSLIRLEVGDLDGNLGSDLEYILSWTKDNMIGEKLIKFPDELERRKLVEKMLSLMLKTHKK